MRNFSHAGRWAILFFALAAYVIAESTSDLWHHEPPTQTLPGIVIATVSAIGMPLLGRASVDWRRG